MSGHDGEVRIGTKLELKELEKDIKEAERKLKEYEKEGEKLSKQKIEMEVEIKAKQDEALKMEVERDAIKDILDKRQAAGQSIEGPIYGNLSLRYQQLEEGIKRLTEEEINLKTQSEQAMETNQQNIQNTRQEIERLNGEYVRAQQEVERYNQQLQEQKKHEQEVNEIKKSIDSVGNSVKRVTGQMVRWGLSLIGINGMMGLVSRSLTLLKNDNKQLGANLNYISFALANAIKPLVEKIVNLVLKLMSYINYIWVRWFGKNLFKDSGAKEYEKSMKNSSKSAKQIKKDLMGFDEINKLSENSSGGAGSGFVSPTMDLSKTLGDKDVPKWVKWIADNKDTILRIVDALISLLVFKKTIQWLMPLANFFGMLSGGNIVKSIGGITNGLSGLILQLGAIAVLCQSVYEWQEGNKQQRKQLNNMAERGVELAKEDVKENHDLKETQEFLNYKRKQGNKILEQSHSLGSKITGTTKEQLKNAEAVSKEDKLYIDQQMEKYRKGELNKEQQEELIKLIKNEKTYNNEVFDELEKKKMSTKEIRNIQETYNGYLEEMGVHIQTAKEKMDLFWQRVGVTKTKTNEVKGDTKTIGDNINAGAKALTEFNKKKINDKTAKINVEANTTKANSTLSTFVSNLSKKLSEAFKNINLSGLGEKLVDGLKKLFPNVKLPNIKNIFAREGGIINNPGRGVRIGSNIIGGEAGAEAILPLDDKTMDRLGSSIARHMNINLTNVTQMNGRTIGRELKTIMNENDFTYNG